MTSAIATAVPPEPSAALLSGEAAVTAADVQRLVVPVTTMSASPSPFRSPTATAVAPAVVRLLAAVVAKPCQAEGVTAAPSSSVTAPEAKPSPVKVLPVIPV